MKKRPFRTRLHLLIVLILLLLTLTTYVVGKYMKTVSFRSEIVVTADLADGVVLQEHKATRLSDGGYALGTELVDANAYTLIPGVDIPKDPHIVITGKSPIKANLFVEIQDTLDTVTVNGQSKKLISYSLTSNWQQEPDRTPKYGGTVYQYNAVLDENFDGNPIYILENNEITVSQYVKSHDYTENKDTDVLKIYVYLEQIPVQ